MRFTTLAIALVLLSACGAADPKATAITPAMLENRAQLEAVANRLEPADRGLFGQYVASRSFVAAGLGPPIVKADGSDPATVGEAIELMRRLEAKGERRDALEAERKDKLVPMQAEADRLVEVAREAGWAPAQVNESNAMGERINALNADYDARIAALQ
jgi:hypothetical protein